MPRLMMSLPSAASAVARASTAKAFSSPSRSKAAIVWSIFPPHLVLAHAPEVEFLGRIMQIHAGVRFCEPPRAMSIGAKSIGAKPAVTDDLKNGTPRRRPERKVLDGRYVRLEPLSAAKHGDGLFEAAATQGEES